MGTIEPPEASKVQDSEQDNELIGRVLEGDQGAFATLVARHEARIRGLLGRLLGCDERARDLAQETFVAAYRGLPSFRQESRFSTWLYRIACNRAASALRRSRPTAPLAAVAEPADSGPGVSAGLEQADLQRVIRKALGELDERFRAVVILADMEDASYEQIAESLGIPVGTVRSRLHRGRLELRERLRPLLEAEAT